MARREEETAGPGEKSEAAPDADAPSAKEEETAADEGLAEDQTTLQTDSS